MRCISRLPSAQRRRARPPSRRTRQYAQPPQTPEAQSPQYKWQPLPLTELPCPVAAVGVDRSFRDRLQVRFWGQRGPPGGEPFLDLRLYVADFGQDVLDGRDLAALDGQHSFSLLLGHRQGEVAVPKDLQALEG